MRRWQIVAWTCTLVGLGLLAALSRPNPGSWVYTSSPYHLGKVFASMEGPGSVHSGIALGSESDGLLWLTGYQAEMVDESGENPVGQEFMCHNTLVLEGDVRSYRSLLGTRSYGSPRVFTLAQGGYRIEFPEGFAIPLPARQKLQLHSQALNLLPEHVGRTIRHRIRSEFVADSQLWRKPEPLFLVEATGRFLLEDPTTHTYNRQQKAGGGARRDEQGRIWTGHWKISPGPHTNVTRVTRELSLPFDTTAHYITSHLHPYARWQELRNVTTGRTVYRVETRWSKDGRSLAEIPAYSSAEGLELRAGDEYDLVTHYDNVTGQPITVMSMLFLYCHDKEFTGYDPAAVAVEGATGAAGSNTGTPLVDELCSGSDVAPTSGVATPETP